jgi:hypothetical protein
LRTCVHWANNACALVNRNALRAAEAVDVLAFQTFATRGARIAFDICARGDRFARGTTLTVLDYRLVSVAAGNSSAEDKRAICDRLASGAALSR